MRRFIVNKKIMKKYLPILSVMILAFGIIFSAVSCSPAKRPGPVQPSPTPTPVPSQPAPTPGPQTTPTDFNSQSQRAQALAQQISKLQAVDAATVVLADDNAWVGINLAANGENQMTNRLQEDITAIVKRFDDDIDRVYVTSDVKLVSRLKSIARDIAGGKPVTDFTQDLNELTDTILSARK
jgi:YhcN/YlaJ family sporulation lipoprotein